MRLNDGLMIKIGSLPDGPAKLQKAILSSVYLSVAGFQLHNGKSSA
jgi:hypothetical protein